MSLWPALTTSDDRPVFHKQDLFVAGEGGYKRYHIPGIVAQGPNVLAWCEARRNDGDWDDIDIVLRRSTDGGMTWSTPVRVASVPGPITKNPVALRLKNVRKDSVCYNNPVMIIDQGGTVHFLFCLEYMRCFYRRSVDLGVTWSEPREITSTLDAFRPRYDWKVIATGPNHGIDLQLGAKRGRLIVPVWLSTGTGGNAHRPSVTATIFSDDSGKSWQAGDIAVPNTPEFINPNETVATELSDGKVMLNVRNESKAHRRIVVVSDDGATGWSKPRFDDALLEPICMAGLMRDPDGWLLFSNPENLSRADGKEQPGKSRDRKNLTIRISYDSGKSWPHRCVIDPGYAAYSDLAHSSGHYLCFYGAADRPHFAGDRLTLVRFNKAWIEANKRITTPH